MAFVPRLNIALGLPPEMQAVKPQIQSGWQAMNAGQRLAMAQREEANKMQQQQALQNIAQQSGGDIGQFGRGALGVAPSVAMQALQLEQRQAEAEQKYKESPEYRKIVKGLGAQFALIDNEADWEMARANAPQNVEIPDYES